MKNMVYCFICNLLLVALIMLTSCNRQNSPSLDMIPAPVLVEPVEESTVIDKHTGAFSGFDRDEQSSFPVTAGKCRVCLQSQTLYGKKYGGLSFSSGVKDSSDAKSIMSDKSRRNLIRWAVSGGM